MNDQPPSGSWEVVKNTKPRIRHTMLRVKDLEKSIDFYTRLFGMKLFRRMENEGGKYSVAFVGYDDENTHPAIELTYNWGQDEDYDKGRRLRPHRHRRARSIFVMRQAESRGRRYTAPGRAAQTRRTERIDHRFRPRS